MTTPLSESIVIAHINTDFDRRYLIEIKYDNHSQFITYIDGEAKGTTGEYEIARNEVGEYAASVVKEIFDKVIENLKKKDSRNE